MQNNMQKIALVSFYGVQSAEAGSRLNHQDFTCSRVKRTSLTSRSLVESVICAHDKVLDIFNAVSNALHVKENLHYIGKFRFFIRRVYSPKLPLGLIFIALSSFLGRTHV